MTGKDIYKRWAPPGSPWAGWVRPVPFIGLHQADQNIPMAPFKIPGRGAIAERQPKTAIFIDLPGYEAVLEGLALAEAGIRPVPLYNGTTGQAGALALVDNSPIQKALAWGAGELEKLEIPLDAPPAFLLDSRRLHRFRMNASVFDNSWDLYEQDIPTVEYFLAQGIDSIILRSDKIHKDLAHIFYKFQKKGMKILFTDGYNQPEPIRIKKPRRERG